MKQLNRIMPKFKTTSTTKEDKTKSPEAKKILKEIDELESQFNKLLKPYNKLEKKLYDVKSKMSESEFKDLVAEHKEKSNKLISLRKDINGKRAKFKELTGTETFRVTGSAKSNSPEIDKLLDQADKLQKEISVMEKPIYKGTATKETTKKVADKYGELSVLINKITKLMNAETANIKPSKFKNLIKASFQQLANIETALSKAKQDQIKAIETQNDGIRKQIENLNKQLDNKNLSKEQKDSLHDRLDTLKERRKFNSNKILDLRD